MTKRDLDAWLSSRTPEEGAEAQAIAAFLTVLTHKAILEGVDLDQLAHIAKNGKSERHRLRASQLLSGARQRAGDSAAHHLAVKEQVMDAKGLRKDAPQVQVFNFRDADLARLQALAQGEPLGHEGPTLPEKAVDAEVIPPKERAASEAVPPGGAAVDGGAREPF